MTGDSETVRAEAMQHYRAGRFGPAVQAQLRVVNSIGANAPASIDDQKRLAAFLFAAGDHRATAAVMAQVVKLAPDDAEALANLGVALGRIEDNEKAEKALARALKLDDSAANTHDAMAACCYRLGKLETARRHGERSLQLKDASVSTQHAHPVPQALPSFSAQDRKHNVIAFSLWGDGARYLDGAVANAEIAPSLYPAWTCRFFVDDTVPAPVQSKLKSLGVQLVHMQRKNPFDGLFWRFIPLNDGATKRFLVRDADAVMNARERAAVEAWLASGKAFHVMRDWWTHTELMLAGMWGGVSGVLPPLPQLLKGFRAPAMANWHVDQWFLRQMVWPTARQSVLVHDSKFTTPGSQDFPPGSDLPEGRHVGQDASVHKRA